MFKLLQENNKPENKNKKPKVIGKKIFQPININWSNLNLGKFALIKMKKNVIIMVFEEKINSCFKQLIRLLCEK